MKCCDNEINLDTKNQTRYNCTLLTPVKSNEGLSTLTLYLCLITGSNNNVSRCIS
jgi:hypothetical protein